MCRQSRSHGMWISASFLVLVSVARIQPFHTGGVASSWLVPVASSWLVLVSLHRHSLVVAQLRMRKRKRMRKTSE